MNHENGKQCSSASTLIRRELGIDRTSSFSRSFSICGTFKLTYKESINLGSPGLGIFILLYRSVCTLFTSEMFNIFIY